ncbi:hypothetical protein F0358_04800 [Empedobacter brevis]|uniref:hypothetical protein n=1 Tax=Empedobacter brevis TaxID=247 RepID=UPI00123D2D1C|nr:hypothetical protein [Empedobacter brevis]QES92079.1 hypothetical protein F0358_04800 [Empedobacter brevis]
MKNLFIFFLLLSVSNLLADSLKHTNINGSHNIFDVNEIKNFKLIAINETTKTVKFSIDVKGNNINEDVYIKYSPRSQNFARTKIIGNYPDFTKIELTASIEQEFINMHRGLIPDIKDSYYSLWMGSSIEKFYYYPPDDSYPFSSSIDIENFKLIDSKNNTLYYSFDIRGKYLTMSYAIYKGSISNSNRLLKIDWNSDQIDYPIFFPEYFTKKSWQQVNTQVISGKYFLVVDYWYNGVKQTKTLEFYKEPVPIPVKKNDVKISNVKIRKIGTSFSQPPLYNSNSPSTPTIEWGYQYEALVTVQNIGEQDVNQQLTLLVRGYDTSNSNSSLFSFTSNFPSIPKGSSVNEFPVVFSQSNMSVQNPNSLEMLLHIDPSNSLNDKNLADNKHTLKYYFKKSNGLMSDLESSTIINIEVYNSAGNKIKSTFVNDLEKGVQEIKKSLPKGHYYFNIDGEKTQVKIQ